MHLRHAAERIRVLHVNLLAGNQFAAVEQLAEPTGRFDLSEVRTHGVDSVGERLDATVEGVERHRGDDIGPVRQALRLQQRPHGESTHVLRTIQQCQALFRGHFYGFPTHFLEHFGTRNHLSADFHFALANERQTEVSQRNEVARGTKRALTIDHGRNVVVEEVDESLHRVELAARIAVAERLNLQQEHDAHDVVFDSRPYTASVTFDEVDLQLRQLMLPDRHATERAETRRHAIDRLHLRGNFLIEILAAAHDSLAGIVAQGQFFIVSDDFADAFNREMLGADVMDLHKILIFSH